MKFQKKAVACLLAFLLEIASFSFLIPGKAAVSAASAPTQSITVGDFESDSEGWSFFPGSEYPGATGAFTRDSTVSHSGQYAGELTGNFAGGGAYVGLDKDIASLDAKAFSFWIKTTDASKIGIRLTDSTGQVHQQSIALQQTSDWQQITVTKFDGGTAYSHWGGANDGVWHGPVKHLQFVLGLSALNGQKTGSVWIDDIAMSTPMPLLTVQETQLGNVFQSPQPAAFDILTQGDALVWSVKDYWGNQVAGNTEPVDASGTKTLTIPDLKCGYYTLNVEAEQNGSPIQQAAQSFAVLSPYDFSQVTDSPFGVCSGVRNFDMLPLLQSAGVKNTRSEFGWESVETQKGVYSFPAKDDSFMSELQKRLIDPLLILDYTNPNYDNNSTPYTDDGRQGFANYGAAVVQHYNSVNYVEVYNEFDLPTYGDRGDGPADARADYYYSLLKQTYQTVKAAKPDISVVGPVTPLDWNWLEQLFQMGGLNYMDVISVHPYRYPSSPEGLAQDLVTLQNLIKKYNNGQTKPIWISEIGWPTETDSRGSSESTEAQYLVRSYAVALGQGVQKMFWYDFKDDGLDKTYSEDNFGIMRNEGDALGKYAPKPAYSAYAAMTRELANKSFEQIETVGDGIDSYLFGNGNDQTRVVWSTDTTRSITVKTQNPITVTDVMGNAETFTPADGNVYLTVSGDPIYINGPVTGITEGSLFTLSGNQAAAGDPLSLNLSVDNTTSGDLSASIEVEGKSVDFSVAAGEKKDIPVSVPGETTPQTKTLFGYIQSGGNPAGKLEVQVPIVDPVSLQVKHTLKANQNALSVDITNNMTQNDYNLDHIDWQIGGQSGSLPASLTVPAGSTKNVDVPIPILAYGQSYSYTLTLDSTATSPVTYTGNVNLADPDSMTPAWEKTITVDGVPDDLSGGPAIDLTNDGTVHDASYSGTDDLSGQINVNWDKTNLYISARIHDDVFSQPFTKDGMWQGDSIQFAVSAGTPGEGSSWYELGMALTPEGPQLYRWRSAQGEAPGLVSDRQLAVTRDEAAKETDYELAIPWTELKPVLPDDSLLSLSFAVNDNDGQGRKGWIEWGSGIASTKGNKLFKAVRLIPAPVTTASVTPAQPDGQNGWYVHPATVSLSASDNVYGVAKTEYSLDGGTTWQTYTAPLTLDQDGQIKLLYLSTDTEGLTEAAQTCSLNLDTTPPVTTAAVGGTARNGWYNTTATVTLSAADSSSGVSKTEYRLGDQGDWTTYTGPITLSQNGRWNLAFRSTDSAGNVEEARQQTVQIDRTLPAFKLTPGVKLVRKGWFFQLDYTLTFRAWDALSGVSSASVSVDGTQHQLDPSNQSELQIDLGNRPGYKTAVVAVEDHAGNTLKKTLHFTVLPGVGAIPCSIQPFGFLSGFFR